MSNYCKNCYDLIKLLNHLKSENDSLKSELMQTNCYLEADKEIIDQLKAKNTQLKKCNERLLQAIIKDQAEIVQKNIDETNISLLRENMDLQRQLDQLKVENESHNNRLEKLHKTLTEIKEVLQFYNNTTIGVDKGNGFFEIEVPLGNFSKSIYYYDTNPAKEALQKISECEVEDEKI